MEQMRGFVPKKQKQSDYIRVKNLTGDVISKTETETTVKFIIIFKKKESTITLNYPTDECEDFFVKEPARMNGVTFFDFSFELRGYSFHTKHAQIPLWELFWSGLTVTDLVNGKTKYKIEKYF